MKTKKNTTQILKEKLTLFNIVFHGKTEDPTQKNKILAIERTKGEQARER